MYLNNRKRNLVVIFIVLVSVFTRSCYNDKEELLYGTVKPVNCDSVPASFKINVLPLIKSKCAIQDCHNPASAMGGRIFTNYNQISAALDRINIRVIVEKTMPQTGSLSSAEISILQCWISRGALDN